MSFAQGFAAIAPIVGSALDRVERNVDQNWEKHAWKNRLRYMVKDAEAAGIHPLYALSGGAPGFQSSSVVSGGASAGAAAGQGYLQATHNKELQKQQLNAAKLDNELRGIQVALARQDLISRGRDQIAGTSNNVAMGGPVPQDMIQPEPAKIPSASSKDPSRSAGVSPGMKRYRIGTTKNGTPITVDLPWSDEGPAESMEGLGALGMSIWKNAERGENKLKYWEKAKRYSRIQDFLKNPVLQFLAERSPEVRDLLRKINKGMKLPRYEDR